MNKFQTPGYILVILSDVLKTKAFKKHWLINFSSVYSKFQNRSKNRNCSSTVESKIL